LFKNILYFHHINICIKNIYSSLMHMSKICFLVKTIRVKLYFSPSSIKRQDSWVINTSWILQNFRFTIFILNWIYIFRESLSKILFYIKKKNLLKYIRISKSTKWNILQIPASNHLGLPYGRHQPSWLKRMNQIVKTKILTDYSIHKLYS